MGQVPHDAPDRVVDAQLLPIELDEACHQTDDLRSRLLDFVSRTWIAIANSLVAAQRLPLRSGGATGVPAVDARQLCENRLEYTYSAMCGCPDPGNRWP